MGASGTLWQTMHTRTPTTLGCGGSASEMPNCPLITWERPAGGPGGCPAHRGRLPEGTFLVRAGLTSQSVCFSVHRLTSPHTVVPIQAPILPIKKRRLQVVGYMTSHGSKVGKGEDGTHTQICILHQPRPQPSGPPPGLGLQSARAAGSGAAKLAPLQSPQLLPRRTLFHLHLGT